MKGVLEAYKDDRRPVFKSSPSQFITVIYSVDYIVTGKDTGKDAGKDTPENKTNKGQAYYLTELGKQLIEK